MTFIDNRFLTPRGDKIFVRAGMSSGPAVAGCVGKSSPRYTFFGETLEKTSKKGKIQCSEMTYRLLHDAPNMQFVINQRVEKDSTVGV